MRLWWHPFSLYPRRARVVVREKGLACEEAIVDLPGGATRAPAFARLDPFGQVPVLEDDGLMGWAGDYLGPACKRWLAPMFAPPEQVDHADVAAARVEIATHLDMLDGVLAAGDDHLAGDFSLADAAYVPFVVEMAAVGLGDLLDARPRVGAWVARLRTRDSVRTTPPGVP